MLKRVFLALLAALTLTLVAAEPALARYRVCNHSSQRVDVAFGYPHGHFGWTSEGWWTIQPGHCRTIMRGPLTNRYYYLYATGSRGSVWQAPSGQEGGFFCTQQDRFVFHNRNHIRNGVLNCAASNLQTKQFLKVDTGGAPNHNHNLTD
jgi:uncharacterized membrane protein